MSTRSRIALEIAPEVFRSVYCHASGSIRGVGATLAVHYRTDDKVLELINLGDLSELGAEIGTQHPFNDRPRGVCTFYGRDRNERGTAARQDNSEAAVLKRTFDCGAEYLYVFRPYADDGAGAWDVACAKNGWQFRPLAPVAEFAPAK